MLLLPGRDRFGTALPSGAELAMPIAESADDVGPSSVEPLKPARKMDISLSASHRRLRDLSFSAEAGFPEVASSVSGLVVRRTRAAHAEP